ncbi:MAG: hypothetical protein GX326_01200 [Clostridiaceae bacterium]|nr:hypothetical protein [Clostridiaceae bacterium]
MNLFANLFVADKIEDEFGHQLLRVHNFRNAFAVPFLPTQLSFSIATIVSGFKIGENYDFIIRICDEQNRDTEIGSLSVTQDEPDSLLTMVMDSRNTPIWTSGMHVIEVLVNDIVIGETKIMILEEDKNNK